MCNPRHAVAAPTSGAAPRARADVYNAELVEVVEVHEGLRILRVRPDFGRLDFVPGQYTVLGLGAWEKPISGGAPWPVDDADARIIKRAYSISSPILDAAGKPTVSAAPAEPVPPDAAGLVEFYVTLVPAASDHPPGLTPRLFALRSGDRLLVGERAKGSYTLAGVRPDDAIVFVATGTGEAPHNAMLAQLLASGHRGPIVSLVSVRHMRDLGYLAVHRRVEAGWPNYRYVPLTTREPQNLDPTRGDYVGKRYVQDVFACGEIDAIVGTGSASGKERLDPAATHVFLCGNPAMLGLPRREAPGSDELVYPRPRGMAELLVERGFTLDTPRRRGNVHFESYW